MKEQRATVAQIKQKLIDNQYKCALTGWSLSPSNFSIDHIISMADGGDDSIENLECVHPLANIAKGTMGKQQFVAMCVAVANHAKLEPSTPHPHLGPFG